MCIGIYMLKKVIQKQRQLNWLRLNRLFLTYSFSSKFKNWFILFYYLKKTKNIKLNGFYYFFLKTNFQKHTNIIYPNANTQVVSKCFNTGYSRGSRWGLSRLTILTKSFKGELNNIGIARW